MLNLPEICNGVDDWYLIMSLIPIVICTSSNTILNSFGLKKGTLNYKQSKLTFDSDLLDSKQVKSLYTTCLPHIIGQHKRLRFFTWKELILSSISHCL